MGDLQQASWSTWWSDGGLGMYPTLLIGLALVGVSLAHVLRPEQRRRAQALSLGALLLLDAAFWFVVSLDRIFQSIATVNPVDQAFLLLSVVGDASHTVLLSLAFAMASTLAFLARSFISPDRPRHAAPQGQAAAA